MERTLHPEFDGEMKLLLDSINTKYSYDFRRYATKSIIRSLVHAMNRMGHKTLPELQKKVLESSDEFFNLLQSITIPVTDLFRDPKYFLSLRENVVPILKTYPSLKIWIAGCSTGEEVYSFAILLLEEELLERTIFYATDINPKSLKKAEQGQYDMNMIPRFTLNYQEAGGKKLLSDYYTSSGDFVKFNHNLVRNVTFADHSLATDSDFLETHFISCRNVLIYFNRELQERVYGLFRESLCRKGFLGLGAQETLQYSLNAKNFETFDKKNRIFRKK